MVKNIRSRRQLDVYQRAFALAMQVYQYSMSFPDEERFGMTPQIRRSSRSVCNNLAEAWRKRRYKAAFVAKLSDAEDEAAETQSHIDFCVVCGFLQAQDARQLYREYNAVLRTLVGMINHCDTWILRKPKA